MSVSSFSSFCYHDNMIHTALSKDLTAQLNTTNTLYMAYDSMYEYQVCLSYAEFRILFIVTFLPVVRETGYPAKHPPNKVTDNFFPEKDLKPL